MQSDILARTSFVSTRYHDPKEGFQRLLDENRARDIARYIDEGFGTIPSSVVVSAQPEAEFKYDSRLRTIGFRDTPKAFLILDGQHRVYGFSLAKTNLRVPVVIYNGLNRKDETRLFIDINTKQRPVSNELLLDIRKLAEYESDVEHLLGKVFDLFGERPDSPLIGLMSSASKATGKISRVSFYAAFKPLLPAFGTADEETVYQATSAYLTAFMSGLDKIKAAQSLVNPTVLRAVLQLFTEVAQRVNLKNGSNYSVENFSDILGPVFERVKASNFLKPGRSVKDLYTTLSKVLLTGFSL
jgi:DGQHR domain-containing protein